MNRGGVIDGNSFIAPVSLGLPNDLIGIGGIEKKGEKFQKVGVREY